MSLRRQLLLALSLVLSAASALSVASAISAAAAVEGAGGGAGQERAFAFAAATGPELSAGTVREIALARARAIGTVAGQADVVGSTLEEAQAAMQGEAQSVLARAQAPEGLDAWLASRVDRVVLRGSFTDTLAKVPPGAPYPTGTVLEYVLDSHTGRVEGVHLGGPAQSPASARAAARRRPGAAVVRRRRRPRARAATWGSACGMGEGHHCYDVAYWAMAGSEQVQGSESDIATDSMSVPEWQRGAFVDDEKWTVFPQRSNGNGAYWVEVGQEAGNGVDCCSLRWFTAWNNGSGYGANESPWSEPGFTFVRYQTVSQLNGSWCFYVEVGNAGCVGGFPVYAKELIVGAEYATPTKPVNRFYEQSNATWTDGTVHAWNTAAWEHSAGTCIEAFSRESPPHYYPGNITGWTC